MKLAIVILSIVVGLIAVVTIVGYLLPVEHTARVERVFGRPAADVWLFITDVERYPTWRPAVESVEVLSPTGEPLTWRESWGGNETMTFRVTTWEVPRTLVVVIADEGLPFGGSWTYQIEPAGDGCRLTITENGEVYNPIFRFVSRLFMDETKTMNVFLDNLESALQPLSQPEGI